MIKQRVLFLYFMLFTAFLFAQPVDQAPTEKDLRNQVLEEIQSGLEAKTRTLETTVTQIDNRLNDLDRAISSSRSAVDKVDKLLERVQELERRQAAIEENELYVFQANYQSAIINLISMDREIKPLKLFDTTKSFFQDLTDTGNPMNYAGYRQWFREFQGYVESQKSSDAGLNVLSNLLTLSGDLSKGTPFSGPIVQPLFTGMASFVNSLGRNRRELREQSERMFELTAKLSQFTHDKNLIESEWTNITEELDEMQKQYNKVLLHNLQLIGVSPNEFYERFTKENDANRRLNYMLEIKQKTADYVQRTKNSGAKDWKENVYYEMMEVQSLKTRFGQITFDISNNISSYAQLIAKYKKDQQLGQRIGGLEIKLNNLRETFDAVFDPLDYLNSTTRMYKIH
ncbi:MAG: hypothetical protein Q4F57_09975 [Weeksellaceae bacterium]|nr:hypothetical protein [Weeksellaceae bacterium]